ncbi:PEPxxWA-CTERM sorting domain-containing protein [Sphingomonas sp. GB1N7]|uniref:PEPxxWA-CTERM sorting domain-containing protein n=1 Tax=Parasphingomonas caseinilytica TaxID=3096158 RepID=UPI002FCAF375
MKKIALAAAAFMSAAAPQLAHAATIVLTFEGLNSSVNESPLNYYNGGAGSAGTTGGPNYGITFSSNTITGCTQPNACANTNAALNPSGTNIIFFLGGGASTMNVAAGFTTGFSFFYSAANNPGVVNVYSGLNSTGTLLASLTLPVTGNGAALPGCQSTNFCPFTSIGVTFTGTAQSVDFGGTNNQIAFDNITLGSATAGGAVPEPATWAMMLMGFGMVGYALRRRAKVTTGVRFA